MKKALIIGSTVVDIAVYVDHLPKSEEDIEPERQSMRIGGCGYNVAHVFQHLGLAYHFVSPLGTGMYADMIAKETARQGIAMPYRTPEINGCTYCLIDHSGERTFLSVHGGEYTFRQAYVKDLNPADYAVAYCCGLELEAAGSDALIDFLTAFPGRIFFAPGPRGPMLAASVLQQMYRLHPILHVNEAEAAALSENTGSVQEAARQLQQKTQAPVIITQAENGCYYDDGEQTYAEPAPAVRVAETTGAGDAHAGAYLSARCCGVDVQRSLKFANQYAAEVVASEGSVLPEDQFPAQKQLLADAILAR